MLIKSHEACMALQAGHVTVCKLGRAASVSGANLNNFVARSRAYTTSVNADSCWVLDFDLLEHFEHVIFLKLLVILIL